MRERFVLRVDFLYFSTYTCMFERLSVNMIAVVQSAVQVFHMRKTYNSTVSFSNLIRKLY